MKLFQSFFKSEPGATLDESLDDCRIVGVCDVSRHEFDLPTHSLAPDYALYLTALAVHPALRRRGVASSLLEAVDAHARGEKLERVILHVEDDNDAAIAFYEARGYAADGEPFKKYPGSDEVYVRMRKPLGSVVD